MIPVTQWAVGTERGLLACYDATFDEVYRCAARLTRCGPAAEDLTQEVFVRLVRAARAGSVTIVGVGWLITTLRHLFIDQTRSATTERARLVLVGSNSAAGLTVGDHEPWLVGLSDRERAALVLRYVDNLPVGEVAALLGASLRATESLLQRAKRRVRGNHDQGLAQA
jgi:RNA polymerase sigma-70 factor (ECF subfamily)